MGANTQIYKFVIIFSAFILLGLPSAGCPAEVALSWTQPGDYRVAGYKIYYGQSGTNFKASPELIIDTPDQTSRIVSGLEDGETYNFAATSFDLHGNESAFSQTVTHCVKCQNSAERSANDSHANEGNGGGSGGGGCFIRTLR